MILNIKILNVVVVLGNLNINYIICRNVGIFIKYYFQKKFKEIINNFLNIKKINLVMECSYLIIIPTINNCHFFAKQLTILKNEVQQFQILFFKNFNSWGIAMKNTPCIVYLYNISPL